MIFDVTSIRKCMLVTELGLLKSNLRRDASCGVYIMASNLLSDFILNIIFNTSANIEK